MIYTETYQDILGYNLQKVVIYLRKNIKETVTVDLIRKTLIWENVSKGKKVYNDNYKTFELVKKKLLEWLAYDKNVEEGGLFTDVCEYTQWREKNLRVLSAEKINWRINIEMEGGLFFTAISITEDFPPELKKIFCMIKHK